MARREAGGSEVSLTNEKWREALDIFLAAAELPENERRSFLHSASVDPELIQKVMAALEDSESRANPAPPVREPQRVIVSSVATLLLLSSTAEVWAKCTRPKIPNSAALLH